MYQQQFFCMMCSVSLIWEITENEWTRGGKCALMTLFLIKGCRVSEGISSWYIWGGCAGVQPMPVQCWLTVADGGPTLCRHWVIVLCLLGCARASWVRSGMMARPTAPWTGPVSASVDQEPPCEKPRNGNRPHFKWAVTAFWFRGPRAVNRADT